MTGYPSRLNFLGVAGAVPVDAVAKKYKPPGGVPGPPARLQRRG